ncbi:hypothetical protein NM688_g115 [Phlebia brevispora]|uniref:Uncharacterized protein n=1 Tax=Phlebia brevispora TaxID=194682 RepID=A0ACC1TFI2_9APHY|nr:hypothetical protein NM688_g115 [Phlebia brevispora]
MSLPWEFDKTIPTGYVNDPSGGRPPTPIPALLNHELIRRYQYEDATVSPHPFHVYFPSDNVLLRNYSIQSTSTPAQPIQMCTSSVQQIYGMIPPNVLMDIVHGADLTTIMYLLRARVQGIQEAVAMDFQDRVRRWGAKVFAKPTAMWNMFRRCDIVIAGVHAVEILWRVNNTEEGNQQAVHLYVPAHRFSEFIMQFPVIEPVTRMGNVHHLKTADANKYGYTAVAKFKSARATFHVHRSANSSSAFPIACGKAPFLFNYIAVDRAVMACPMHTPLFPMVTGAMEFSPQDLKILQEWILSGGTEHKETVTTWLPPAEPIHQSTGALPRVYSTVTRYFEDDKCFIVRFPSLAPLEPAPQATWRCGWVMFGPLGWPGEGLYLSKDSHVFVTADVLNTL